jgi:Sec-independent protein translocase protein TatA
MSVEGRAIRELTRAIKDLKGSMDSLERTLREAKRDPQQEAEKFIRYQGETTEETLEKAKAGEELIQSLTSDDLPAKTYLCTTCSGSRCVPGSKQKYTYMKKCACCEAEHTI